MFKFFLVILVLFLVSVVLWCGWVPVLLGRLWEWIRRGSS